MKDEPPNPFVVLADNLRAYFKGLRGEIFFRIVNNQPHIEIANLYIFYPQEAAND